MTKKKVEKAEDEWRQELTPEEFAVCRQKGTERAFTGKYNDYKAPGVYYCTCCGDELFTSEAKFDSGTGWPSFTTPVKPDAVQTEDDNTYGMTRTEVMCGSCGAHLGHVFPDGPGPKGQRYCMNSVALKHSDDK